jgi:metal-responsive CopG/Arc/MetJ family transcriptional regulator
MTLDEELVRKVDRAVGRLKTTRSAFTREALNMALRREAISQLERQHRAGYTAHPVAKGEFDVWENEQSWDQG